MSDITKFGLPNFNIENIEEEKSEENSYQNTIEKLNEITKKTWICPQDWNGITIVELEKSTVEEFCSWAIQIWPPLKEVFKKTLPKKEEFESFFNYIVKMHKILNFPKGSMTLFHN